MVEHLPTLVTLTRVTLGMPSGGFGTMEISVAAEAVRYAAGWADKFPGESHMQEDGFMKITRQEPLGVVAAIIPFNAPIAVLCHKIGGALITGNCFIIKPSEKTPLATLALGQLAKVAASLPASSRSSLVTAARAPSWRATCASEESLSQGPLLQVARSRKPPLRATSSASPLSWAERALL